MTNTDHISQYVFLGVGGMGMSALARYYHFSGREVLGYDRTLGPVALQLQKEGIWLTTDMNALWDTGKLKSPGHTRIVYTAAIPADDPMLNRLRSEGYAIRKRAVELGEVVQGRNCMAVAGTHGKTTTASILTHLLVQTGQPVTAFLGGISEDLGSNFVHSPTIPGKERVYVVEADEFDRSFLQLHPSSACVTSLDADHLDIYGTPEELESAYGQFVSQVTQPERVFAPAGLQLRGQTLALEQDADYALHNIRIEAGRYRFDYHYPDGVVADVWTSLPGRHNLMNALGALALAGQVQPARALARALESCKGVWRRFNTLYRSDKLTIIDDYAHHPTEIEAVYDALREMYPGQKLSVLFQPHLYSRTRDFGDGFGQSLSRFAVVRLLPVYPAREEPLAGIDSGWLLDKVDCGDKGLLTGDEITEWIRQSQGGVLAVLGAGDIGEMIRVSVTQIEREE